jgi:hypothetical protein
MMEDEIVNEIHETRRRIFEEECGGDIERLIERLQALDAKDKHRLVTFEQVQQRARSPKTPT